MKYITENNIMFDFPDRQDIQLTRKIDIEHGQCLIEVDGLIGKELDISPIKLDIPLDLLRQLKRGDKAYERSLKHLPDINKIRELIMDRLMYLQMEEYIRETSYKHKSK